MSSQLTTATAVLALLGAGLASAEGTRSDSALPAAEAVPAVETAPSAAKCRVEVVRTGAPGTAAITRLAEAGGGCACTVTTGPSGANGQAEDVVGALLQNATCDGAPAPGQNPPAFAPGPNLLPLLAVPAAGAGAAVAGGAGGGDSPG